MPEGFRKLTNESVPDTGPERMQGGVDRLHSLTGAPVLCMLLRAGRRLETVAAAPPAQQPVVLELSEHPELADALEEGTHLLLEGDGYPELGSGQALLVPWGDEHRSGVIAILAGPAFPMSPEIVDYVTATVPERMRAMGETIRLERRIAELEQTSAAFRALVESTSDAVKVLDLDGRVRVWNRACERLYGYTAQEVVGQVLPHVPPEGRARSIRKLRESAALGVEQTSESIGRRKDGSSFTSSITALPLADADGLPVGIFSIVRGVDSDSRLDQMQSDFMSLVTQELKNPLTAILGYAQLLSRPEVRDDPAKRSRTIAALERRAKEMSGLIDDLLLASRIDRDELVLRPTRTDLSALVTDTVTAFEPTAPRHRFLIDVETRMPAVHVDGPRISLALTHLLSNAVKHSNFSEEVVVKAVRDADFVSISVTDRGEGLSEQELSRAFDRFYKRSGGDPGMGLGLFLVRTIVEAHGGTLTVFSKPGKGTTFTMRIPIARR